MRALSHARGPKCYVLVFDLNKIERVDLTAQRIDSALRIMFEQREDNTHSKKKKYTHSFGFRTEYTHTNVQESKKESPFFSFLKVRRQNQLN